MRIWEYRPFVKGGLVSAVDVKSRQPNILDPSPSSVAEISFPLETVRLQIVEGNWWTVKTPEMLFTYTEAHRIALEQVWRTATPTSFYN